MAKLISIVTPCYNEALNVENHLNRVLQALAPFAERYDFEFVYTDNRSQDLTFATLSKMAARDPRVKVVRFSRNIGAMRAMIMGLSFAKGDAVILIQADLQDPPELIPKFIEAWESGYDVVYGKIEKRNQENFVLQSLRKLYYILIDRLSEVPVPRNAGDFRLMSRQALDALLTFRDYEMYLRGAVAHVGFPAFAVPYVRQPRVAGESNAPFFYLVNFALNSFFATSVVPLRIVTYFGLITGTMGFLMAVYFITLKLFSPLHIPEGVTGLNVLITFFSGSILFALGILGEYLRKIYIEVLGRPRGFPSEKINFD